MKTKLIVFTAIALLMLGLYFFNQNQVAKYSEVQNKNFDEAKAFFDEQLELYEKNTNFNDGTTVHEDADLPIKNKRDGRNDESEGKVKGR